MSPADSWQRSDMPSDRSYPSDRAPRFDRDRDGYVPRSPRSAPPPPRSRSAAGDRGQADRLRGPERGYGSSDYRRAPGRRPEEPSRSRAQAGYGDPAAARRPSARNADGRPPRGDQRVETGGSRLRGIVAVVAVLLVTLAACGVESFVGSGLGIVTTVALIGASALAAFLVRRRDLVSVVVAPPLIYVAVALVDVVAAPSATFSVTTLATLLIRGFPAMAIGTAVALVIALIRAAAKR